MKIARKESIEIGEKELLDTIIAELDWDVIEEKLREKHNIKLQEDVEFSNGDLVVHGNKIAYKLNFEVKILLSVIFDRLGECLDITAAGAVDPSGDVDEDDFEIEDEDDFVSEDEFDSEEPGENNDGSEEIAPEEIISDDISIKEEDDMDLSLDTSDAELPDFEEDETEEEPDDMDLSLDTSDVDPADSEEENKTEKEPDEASDLSDMIDEINNDEE